MILKSYRIVWKFYGKRPESVETVTAPNLLEAACQFCESHGYPPILGYYTKRKRKGKTSWTLARFFNGYVSGTVIPNF